jgi:hypothetical protein
MSRGGFELGKDPGSWLGPMGIPVDLMIPARMSDPGGRRGGRVPPHSKRATRRASGLEAAIVDHAPAPIAALDSADRRSFTIHVAGPAALLVAKLHKLGERDQRDPDRLNDKDAHDVYRLLVAVDTQELSRTLRMLLSAISRRRRRTSRSTTWTTSSSAVPTRWDLAWPAEQKSSLAIPPPLPSPRRRLRPTSPGPSNAERLPLVCGPKCGPRSARACSRRPTESRKAPNSRPVPRALCRTRTGDPFLTINARGVAACCPL